jgi:hypothetical protein
MTKYEPEMQKSAFPKLTEPNGLDTGPIPIEPYISAEWFEKEREQIFGRAWLCMGRIEQLPEPDTYIVKEIEVRGVIALITRDKADKVRAFHNVCSHRANMIVQGQQRQGQPFRLQVPQLGLPQRRRLHRCSRPRQTSSISISRSAA